MKGNNMAETKMITEYLRESNCPRATMHTVVSHIRQVIRHATGYQEEALLRMPFSLRNQLKSHINRDTMDKLPFLRYIQNESVRVFLFDLLEKNVADNGLSVVREGARCGEVIFLVSGSALICRLTPLGRRELGDPVEMLYGHGADSGPDAQLQRRSSKIHPGHASTHAASPGSGRKAGVRQETKAEHGRASPRSTEAPAAAVATRKVGGRGEDLDTTATTLDMGASGSWQAGRAGVGADVTVEDVDQVRLDCPAWKCVSRA